MVIVKRGSVTELMIVVIIINTVTVLIVIIICCLIVHLMMEVIIMKRMDVNWGRGISLKNKGTISLKNKVIFIEFSFPITLPLVTYRKFS